LVGFAGVARLFRVAVVEVVSVEVVSVEVVSVGAT
jgi:hypothetical protein